jgi:hypothetical protein
VPPHTVACLHCGAPALLVGRAEDDWWQALQKTAPALPAGTPVAICGRCFAARNAAPSAGQGAG